MIKDVGIQNEIAELTKKLNSTIDGLQKIEIKKEIISKFQLQRKLSLLSKTRTDYLMGGFYDN